MERIFSQTVICLLRECISWIVVSPITWSLLELLDPEDKGTMFLTNIRNQSPDTGSHPRRLESSTTPPSEPQTLHDSNFIPSGTTSYMTSGLWHQPQPSQLIPFLQQHGSSVLTMALCHGPASSPSVTLKTPNSFCKQLKWHSRFSVKRN
jgi:hypothetical protein